MRRTSTVVFLAVDDLIPFTGEPQAGLREFAAALDHAGIPAVWLSSRTRLQLDGPRRNLGHSHPFVAEDGCGVYLPEDYFHLRPQSLGSQQRKPVTVRLGRFTCIPVAERQPVAAEALEALSTETGVPVVPLRTLSSRELAQNLSMPPREAELARHRDFDELFFFAGVSNQDVERFLVAGTKRSVQVRRRHALLSLAIGASTRKCIQELSNLYDRALRSHAQCIGVSMVEDQKGIRSACDRFIALTREQDDKVPETPAQFSRFHSIPFGTPGTWEQLLEAVGGRKQ